MIRGRRSLLSDHRSPGMRTDIRPKQVANHALVTRVMPSRLAFEELQRPVVQRQRYLGLRRDLGQFLGRRKNIFDAHPVAVHLAFVVSVFYRFLLHKWSFLSSSNLRQ